jgi:hypothetical protein
VPKSAEIDEAMQAMKAFRAIIRHGQFQRLEPELQKSLSSFSFSNNG